MVYAAENTCKIWTYEHIYTSYMQIYTRNITHIHADISICICMYVHVCACICMYLACISLKTEFFPKWHIGIIHTHITKLYLHVCVCIVYCLYICICLILYLPVCVCIGIYMYVSVYICMYRYIYVWIMPWGITMPQVDVLFTPETDHHVYACICMYLYVLVCIMIYEYIFTCICMYMFISYCICMYMHVYDHIILYMHVLCLSTCWKSVEKTEWALTNDGMPAHFLVYHSFAGAAIPSRHPTWNEL